jgi:hypothetical protein
LGQEHHRAASVWMRDENSPERWHGRSAEAEGEQRASGRPARDTNWSRTSRCGVTHPAIILCVNILWVWLIGSRGIEAYTESRCWGRGNPSPPTRSAGDRPPGPRHPHADNLLHQIRGQRPHPDEAKESVPLFRRCRGDTDKTPRKTCATTARRSVSFFLPSPADREENAGAHTPGEEGDLGRAAPHCQRPHRPR